MALDLASFIGVFKETYEGSINGLWYTEVAGKPVNVNTIIGTYPGLDAVAGLTAFNGTRQGKTPGTFKVTLTNATFEDSLVIPVPEFSADFLGLYQNAVGDMAIAAQFQWNELSADLLKNGHSANCFDGKKFFATDHPVGSGNGTQSNLWSASDIASLAVTDKTKPTPAEVATIIVDTVAQMQTLTNKATKPANGAMRRIAIFTGDAHKFAAIQTACTQLNLVGAVAGSNPVVSGLISYGFTFVPVLEPTLTGDSLYFVRTDSQVKALILQEFGDISYTVLDGNSEYAKTTNNVSFGVFANRAAGYGRYTSAAKVTLSNKA